MEKEIRLEDLLRAGVHFGHSKSRWNPKMRPYIFDTKENIHIINLEKTIEGLSRAVDFAESIAKKGGVILFVGTKKQAAATISEEAMRCGMPYVNNRWLGGMLTNFATIKKQIEKLGSLEQKKAQGGFEGLTKKERALKEEEIQKLSQVVGGFRMLSRPPQALFVVDTKKEFIAVREAKKLNLPIIGIVDTNANPEIIDWPIPANDDAIASVKLITSLIADAIIEGKKQISEGETVIFSEGGGEKEELLGFNEEEGEILERRLLDEDEDEKGKKRIAKVGRDKES